MSRPSNWHSMSRGDQRAWEDAEYDREEAERTAERAQSAARAAKRYSDVLRQEREELLGRHVDEVDDLQTRVAEERDRYCAASLAIDLIVAAVRSVIEETAPDVTHPAWVTLLATIADQGPPLGRVPEVDQ